MPMKPGTIYRVGMLLIAVIAVGLLESDQIQYNSLMGKYDVQSTAIAKLNGEVAAVNSALNASLSEQQSLIADYTRTQGTLNAPGMNQTIVVWTIPRTLTADNWTAWALLDTFVNNVDVAASGSVNFQIVTLGSFADFYYHHPYAPLWNYTGTHFAVTVRLTQGCGYYVLIVRNLANSSVVLTPNVTARYAPTPFVTGACST